MVAQGTRHSPEASFAKKRMLLNFPELWEKVQNPWLHRNPVLLPKAHPTSIQHEGSS